MSDTLPSAPEYLLADETAELLRTPLTTLYQWRLRDYGPPARRVGRKLVYKRSEVLGWLDEQTISPHPAA